MVLTLVPVSKNLLSGVAGALFGLVGGIAISWVASMLSALVCFAIARRLGREAVAEMTGPRLAGSRRSCATRGSRRWSWPG